MPLKQKNHIVVDMCIGVPVFLRHSVCIVLTVCIKYDDDQWHRNEFESWGSSVPRKSGGGAPIRLEAPEKNFLVVPLQFLALKAQLVVLVSAFVMVSTVWSVSGLLFFYSRCPPRPNICKSGGTCPMESTPLVMMICNDAYWLLSQRL